MRYRCVATSVKGFVQQIATCYLRHGYWWYVTGKIPEHKDPANTDTKLVEKYNIDITEWRRSWQKKNGLANMQYLRHGHFFVLMATKGQHEFFTDEATRIRDIRKTPIRYAGYAISYRPGGRTREGERDPRWHAHVQIDRKRYSELKAWFEDYAPRRKPEWVTACFRRFPFEPYAPVRRQQLNILRSVNRRRKAAGQTPIPTTVLRTRRRVVRPFD
jgi:hypothetical protein